MGLHWCRSIRLILGFVTLRFYTIYFLALRIILRWGASVMIRWFQILIFPCLMIMWIGRVFTGTLSNNYCWRFRSHVVGLWVFIHLLMLTMQVMSWQGAHILELSCLFRTHQLFGSLRDRTRSMWIILETSWLHLGFERIWFFMEV